MSSISCSRCQHGNPQGAKFCNECGCALRLESREQWDALNAVDARIGRHCGAHFLDATLPTNAAAVSQPSAAETASDSKAGRTPEAAAEQPTSFQIGLEGDSTALSAVRLDPLWRESWRATGPVRPPLSPFESAVALGNASQQDAVQLKDSGAISAGGRWVKYSRHGIIAGALLIALSGAAFYSYKQTNTISAPIENRSPGSSAIGISAIGSPPGEPSKPVTRAVNQYSERGGSVSENPNRIIDTNESISASTGQRRVADAVIAPKAQQLESDVSSAATAETIPATGTTVARQLNPSRGPAKMPAQASSPDPRRYRAPTRPCTDSIAALGLCNMDGVSGGR